jgi:lipid-A-disaccharide synthase
MVSYEDSRIVQFPWRIDFSEFHIKLAKKIKRIIPSTKIIKYVSPQIWASREKRISDIAKYYDCLCCILPFEPEIYRNEEIDCRFVGHPLMDKYEVKTGYGEFYEKFGLSDQKTLVSIFPGSRVQEIKKHMPVIKEFIDRIIAVRDDIELVICKSSNLPENIFDRYALPASTGIISSEYQWEIMSYSGIVLCKSGTSTLQSAITETPAVIFYKVNPLSYMIAKSIVKTEYISLPNIIAGKQINPELIQSEFTSENLLSEVVKLLNNDEIYSMRKRELGLVREMLGEKGAGLKVSEAVADYMRK